MGAKQMLSAPETETSSAHEWRRPKGSKPARPGQARQGKAAFQPHRSWEPEIVVGCVAQLVVSKSLQQMGRTEGKKPAWNNPAAADGMLLS